MPSNPRRQLEDWVKSIDVKADVVLDVGGAQLPIKKRVKSWDVKEYKILDLEMPHEGSKPDIVCDINKLQRLENMASIKANVVFCLEVMEYIWHPVATLVNIRNAMAMDDSGILYISFPFLYPHHNPKGLDYMRYTRWGAEKLLTECGFKIIKNTPRIANEGGLEYLSGFYGAEGMRMAAGYDGHDETGYLIKAAKVV